MSLIHLTIDFNPLHHPFPWIVSVGNVASVFCTRRGKIVGWYILALAQLVFIAHSVTTPTDTGFLLGNLGMLLAAMDSIRIWRRRADGRVPAHLERAKLPRGGQVRHSSATVVPPASVHPAASER